MVFVFVKIYAGPVVYGAGISDSVLYFSAVYTKAGTGTASGGMAYCSGKYHWSDGVYSASLFDEGV